MKHWPTKSLGSFCQTGSGATPLRGKPEYFDNGTVPWVKSGELKDPVVLRAAESITVAATKETNAHIVPKNAVLIAMYGATVGDTAILGIDAATNQAICHIIPDPDTAHFRFVWYALKNRLDEFLSKRVGGAQPNISQKIIRDTLIAVPPLAEQERIVKLLDEVNALRNLRADADRRAAALIPALFHEMFGEDNDWQLEQLVNLCERITVGHVGPMATQYVENGVTFLRGQNIKRGRLDLSSVLFVSEKFHKQLGKSAISPGDVVSVRTGKPGTTAVIPPSLEVANCADLIVMTCGPQLNPHFLCELLNERLGDKDIIAGATGIAQQHFNIGEARKLKFALPPLSLQNNFAKRMAEIRELEANQSASRRSLDALFQSMLHRAFAGEI